MEEWIADIKEFRDGCQEEKERVEQKYQEGKGNSQGNDKIVIQQRVIKGLQEAIYNNTWDHKKVNFSEVSLTSTQP